MMSCPFQLSIMAIVLRKALSPGTYEIRVLGGSKNFISPYQIFTNDAVLPNQLALKSTDSKTEKAGKIFQIKFI